MNTTLHTRNLNNPAAAPRIETRTDGVQVLIGYSAVFYREGDANTEYNMGWGIRERIGPTAFERAIKEQHDARCRADHQTILGRVSAGTLRLTVDQIGLRYECDLPATTVAKDYAVSIARKDISGSSFAFRKELIEWTEDDVGEIRTLTDLELVDVGPVGFPAYKGTTSELRATGDAESEAIRAARDAWKAARSSPADEVAVRCSLLDLDDAELAFR